MALGGYREGAGRKPDITQEKVKTLVQAIKRGHFLVTAIGAIKTSKPTVYHWLSTGEALVESGDTPKNEAERLCIELYHGINEADYMAQDRSLAVILGNPQLYGVEDSETPKAGKQPSIKDAWKAHAWWMERRHRNLWGLIVKEQTDNNGNVNLIVNCESSIPTETNNTTD